MMWTSSIARSAEGATICLRTIGDRADPTILLIGRASWSMDWWPRELCRRIADRGGLVIRYDHRDTGRSSTYPPGSPTYTGADMVVDAVAVLDEHPSPTGATRQAVIDYIVDGERPFAAHGDFDESLVRAIAEVVLDRSRSLASMRNHFLAAAGEQAHTEPSELARSADARDARHG